MKRTVTIISLTERGYVLGKRLQQTLQTDHRHKPQPFTTEVQRRYRDGQRLIFISATGIAIRALAPVLTDKYQDPAVLVLDEQGRFVIPLLSGHQGGANEWARQVADTINAHCVITSAQRYTQPVYVAGVGCDSGCPRRINRSVSREHPARLSSRRRYAGYRFGCQHRAQVERTRLA